MRNLTGEQRATLRALRPLWAYVRANTANHKAPPHNGNCDRRLIAGLVREYGRDAAAEEAIVHVLVTRFPPRPDVGYVNTDLMRHVIRKAQGRPRPRSLGPFADGSSSDVGDS